mmetsp:Transcript_23486/g.47546  ORF Transcript_23486/g.47546 Transcript_23486/m.47546 type:complete len:170 (-) Transcript_23486:59-568(-)
MGQENSRCCQPDDELDHVEKLDKSKIDYSAVEEGYASTLLSRLSITTTTTTVQAPKEVELTRSGPHWRSIGLMVKQHHDGQECLPVTENITPSLISAWNEQEDDELKKVHEGDMIVSINGVTTVDAMLRAIQASGKGSVLKLIILAGKRPASVLGGVKPASGVVSEAAG